MNRYLPKVIPLLLSIGFLNAQENQGMSVRWAAESAPAETEERQKIPEWLSIGNDLSLLKLSIGNTLVIVNADLRSPPQAVAATPVSENKQGMARQPKQKHPQLVIPPEQPNPTTERLQRELGAIQKNDPTLALKLERLWKESVEQLPATALPSATDARVAVGTMLPKEITDGIQAPSNGINGASPQAMLNGLGLVMAAARSDLLSQYATQRANTLPPTVADVAIFEALNQGINELSLSKGSSTFEVWQPLADATNPVYRLLALRAAIHTTSKAASGLSSEDPNYTRIDAPAKLGFYLSFLDESDPIILAEAIAAVATVPTPEARQAIEKFQATQQQSGDASLPQAAAEALRTQELITQGTR